MAAVGATMTVSALAPFTIAGYAVADNWNDVHKATDTTGLVDSNGIVTGAEITFNTDYSYSLYNNVDDVWDGTGTVLNGFPELMKNATRIANSDFGHSSGSEEKELLQVKNIPYSSYVVVVYMFNDGGGRTGKVNGWQPELLFHQ